MSNPFLNLAPQQSSSRAFVDAAPGQSPLRLGAEKLPAPSRPSSRGSMGRLAARIAQVNTKGFLP